MPEEWDAVEEYIADLKAELARLREERQRVGIAWDLEVRTLKKELARLREENESLKRPRCQRRPHVPRAQRDTLLAALRGLLDDRYYAGHACGDDDCVIRKARAAISEVEGEK